MEDNNLLPVLAEQNKQYKEIKLMLDKLAQMPRPTTDNPNENPLYIDYRKIDSFMLLQNAYYNIFAQQKISLEYVPYGIIAKSIKWAEKNYKKDLKKQVHKKYKKLIKAEKRAKRAVKTKRFFNVLFSPFKKIFNGMKSLFIKIFKKKKNKVDAMPGTPAASPVTEEITSVKETSPE